MGREVLMCLGVRFFLPVGVRVLGADLAECGVFVRQIVKRGGWAGWLIFCIF